MKQKQVPTKRGMNQVWRPFVIKNGFSVHRSLVVTVPYKELAVSGSSTEVKIEKYRRQWHKGTELYRSHYSCLN